MSKTTILPSDSAFTRVSINGERIAITRPTKEECIAEYLALKHGAKKPEKKTTLYDALTRYIQCRIGKKSPASLKAYISYRDNRLQSMVHANIYTTNAQWQAAVDRDFRKLSKKYAKNV